MCSVLVFFPPLFFIHIPVLSFCYHFSNIFISFFSFPSNNSTSFFVFFSYIRYNKACRKLKIIGHWAKFYNYLYHFKFKTEKVYKSHAPFLNTFFSSFFFFLWLLFFVHFFFSLSFVFFCAAIINKY
jgi:hypothetical protein